MKDTARPISTKERGGGGLTRAPGRWLILPEEEYYLFAPGEQEDWESADQEFRVGDCVTVLCDDDAEGCITNEAGQNVSIGRLVERVSESTWTVRWFFHPHQVPAHTRDKFKTIRDDTEIFYSLSSDEVPPAAAASALFSRVRGEGRGVSD